MVLLLPVAEASNPVVEQRATTLEVAGPVPVPLGVNVTVAAAVPAKAAVVVKAMSQVYHLPAGIEIKLLVVAVAELHTISDAKGVA